MCVGDGWYEGVEGVGMMVDHMSDCAFVCWFVGFFVRFFLCCLDFGVLGFVVIWVVICDSLWMWHDVWQENWWIDMGRMVVVEIVKCELDMWMEDLLVCFNEIW